ncbi:MAG: hypothetical protein U0Q18_24695 [Bryobacteraceae bacterium]
MPRLLRLHIVIACIGLVPGCAQAIDCSGLPTSFTGNEFPTGDFFSNFNNPCFTIPLATGNGNGKFGDLNARYFQIYFKVDPRYQLILLDTFPNARYFSVTVYDAHSAYTQSLQDSNIVPLTPAYINPYKPGVPFAGGQQFAVPINFGGTPGSLETGCKMTGYNVSANGLNATERHPGMDWNSDSGLFRTYPNYADHIVDTPQHSNPNTAGVVLVRAYLDITSSTYRTSPHIIVRDVQWGCAYPAQYAVQTLQIVTANAATGSLWLDQDQGHAHNFYDTSYLPELCYADPAPPAHLSWRRQPEYVAGAAPDSSYIVAPVSAGLPAKLAQAGEVMRVRFQTPTTPPTPCTNGCSRSGNEQMRYMSLSFLLPGGNTIASLADNAFTKDSNGFVTLIVGTGASVPAWITSANGYTFLDLTQVPNFQQLSLLDLRNILPGAGFTCAGQYVPYRTGTATPSGSLMGAFAPVVDYPVAANLPKQASPLGSSACDVFPTGESNVRPSCSVLPSPAIAIGSVITQCPAPGCSQFVAQANPPVTITGGGFGDFPQGMPFGGFTDYLRISNTTRGWSAGHTGDSCAVSITSWAANRIQFTAAVGQGGHCPLAAGDRLIVRVWNPETLASVAFNVTVSGP